jgi:hypothetical protein
MYFLDHMGIAQLSYNLLPSNLVLNQISLHVFGVKGVFSPEKEATASSKTFGSALPNHTVSHPRRQKSSTNQLLYRILS